MLAGHVQAHLSLVGSTSTDLHTQKLTASTLCAALLLLALHPEAQEAILQETAPIFERCDQVPPFFSEHSNFVSPKSSHQSSSIY